MGGNVTKEKLCELVEKDDAKHLGKAIDHDASHAQTILEDFFHCTLLHWAGRYNASKCARVLLDAGVDVNKTDDNGEIALHNAAMMGNAEVGLILIQAGSDLSAVGGEEPAKTPLQTVLASAGLVDPDDKEEVANLAARKVLIEAMLEVYGSNDDLDINQSSECGKSSAMDWLLGSENDESTPGGLIMAEWTADVKAKLEAAGGVLLDAEFLANLEEVRQMRKDIEAAQST